jgi:hypothetical protein
MADLVLFPKVSVICEYGCNRSLQRSFLEWCKYSKFIVICRVKFVFNLSLGYRFER